MSISRRLSMPKGFAIAPISLPNATFKACQALSTYFISSAVSKSVAIFGPGRSSYKAHCGRNRIIVKSTHNSFWRRIEITN